MNELETLLKNHDWSLDGYATRPKIDQLMKSHTDPVEAKNFGNNIVPGVIPMVDTLNGPNNERSKIYHCWRLYEQQNTRT